MCGSFELLGVEAFVGEVRMHASNKTWSSNKVQNRQVGTTLYGGIPIGGIRGRVRATEGASEGGSE